MAERSNQKEQALRKLNAELAKDVAKIVELAKLSGFIELQLVAFELHKARLASLHPDQADPTSDPGFVRTTSMLESDAIKYALQTMVKHGDRSKLMGDKAGNLLVRRDVVEAIIGSASVLNAKAELASLIDVFDVVQEGLDGRSLRVELGASAGQPEISRLLAYARRLDADNALRRQPKPFEELLRSFEQAYTPYADLFEIEFVTSLANAVALYRFLIEETQRRITANEKSFQKLPNGNVDLNHPLTALAYLRGCYLKLSDIEARFGSRIRPVLDRLTFDPEAFDVNELRYHGVTRTPLFRWSDDERLVIGELVLDSLFTNTHYSLLENAGTIFSGKTSVAQEYKHRYSERFLDGMTVAAAAHGYREVSRGVDLIEGRDQLGDMDIVFVNDAGHYLIVEAKNHMLPLPVFFMDRMAVEQRREELRADWERKVLRRQEHLRREHARYGIGHDFTYLIVSRQPEFLAHTSPILVLSVAEFHDWLALAPRPADFASFYERVYGKDPEFTPEQLKQLRARGLTVFGTEPPTNL